MLDLSLARCACLALRRSSERLDFWPWLWSYRSKSLPLVLTAIATHAPTDERHVLPTPADVERFIDQVGQELRIAAEK